MNALQQARQAVQDSFEGDKLGADRAQAFALIAIAEHLEVLVDAALLTPTLAGECASLLGQLVADRQPRTDHPAVRWDGPGCLMCDVDVDAHPRAGTPGVRETPTDDQMDIARRTLGGVR